jgi:hypothetical protein
MLMNPPLRSTESNIRPEGTVVNVNREGEQPTTTRGEIPGE